MFFFSFLNLNTDKFKVDFIFVALSGIILVSSFNLQKSLGDVIADEAELSNSQKDKKTQKA